MPDLLYIRAPGEQRSPSEWRQFHRWAARCDYTRIVVLPDNQRGDLHRAPGVVVGPGVTFASSVPSLHQEVPS